LLSKINRLTKERDFEEVFKNGKTIRGDFLVLKVLKNNFKNSRFGFVISKKVSNKATIRNKIKRRLRNVILKEIKNIEKSVDIIIIALPKIKEKEFLEIKEMVSNILKKI